MPAPAFLTEPQAPTMQEVAARVGTSWEVLGTALQQIPRARPVWKQSKTSGWYLTFDVGAKRLFYCFPQMGNMLLKIVYNDKGVMALRDSGKVDEKLKQAKKYPEGTLLEYQATELDGALLADLLRIKAMSIK